MARSAIILSLHEDNRETEELLASLGYEVAAIHVQRRGRPDAATFVGKGKLEEIRASILGPREEKAVALRRARDVPMAGKPDLVVVNGDLRASQLYAMESTFATRVLDRIGLILEIFADRATTEEARLQVEYAKLTFEIPMVKEFIHMTKRGEHPGFMAGGDYSVDNYYITIQRRRTRIRKELERIRKERSLRREHRRKGGYHLVSLAGYTNAGKSALLRCLSGADVTVENRLFSTLSTTTRRADSPKRHILVTDTVGFIERLPPWLVEAFHSTLEEVSQSDVIVLVVDASDAVPEIERKLRVSLGILWDLKVASPILVAVNKIDRVTPEHLDLVLATVRAKGLVAPENWVCTSALQGTGIPALYEAIENRLPRYVTLEADLAMGPASEALLSRLYDATDVVDVTRGESIRVRFEVREILGAQYRALLDSHGAVWAT